MENSPPEKVMCPLVDAEIEAIDCIENRDCIDGMLKLSCLPDEYRQKDGFQEICKRCKWHDY